MHELGVEYLEYKPGALRDILESDVNSHPIETWQRRFKRLHDLNAEAGNLYMKYPGMLDTELEAALKKFVFHANQWHDYWRDLRHETPRVDERGFIVANPFPKEVVPALESEIEKLEGLA
jgi:hypothetical protein